LTNKTNYSKTKTKKKALTANCSGSSKVATPKGFDYKEPRRLCEYDPHLQGPAQNKFGGRRTQKIKGLRGNTYGAASPCRTLPKEERDAVEADLRARGMLDAPKSHMTASEPSEGRGSLPGEDRLPTREPTEIYKRSSISLSKIKDSDKHDVTITPCMLIEESGVPLRKASVYRSLRARSSAARRVRTYKWRRLQPGLSIQNPFDYGFDAYRAQRSYRFRGNTFGPASTCITYTREQRAALESNLKSKGLI
jgi:hypothetical protein